MAASLRAAATRILRPEVLPGAGLRRLVHTEQQHSIPHRASQLKQKKEELFDLITQAEALSATTWYDRRVLLDLVMQVKPRPNDPQWRNVMKRKVVRATFLAAGTYIYWCTLRWFNNSRPKIVDYNGYKVTAESLPVLQGYQPAATAEGVHKHDGYQSAPTSEEVHKQEQMEKQIG